MKNKFYLITLSILLCSPALSDLKAQAGRELEQGYYVTVGVYAKSKEGYAQNFVNTLRKDGIEVDYGFSTKKKYYYVYVFSSGNYREAINDMRETRKNERFPDAWVYVHLPGDVKIELAENEKPTKGTKEVQPKEGAVSDSSAVQVIEKGQEETTATSEGQMEEPEARTDSVAEVVAEESETLTDTEGDKKEKIKNLGDVDIVFNLFNARNSEPVDGEVQIVDAERSKLIRIVKSGEPIRLSDPYNRSGKLILISDVFGFRKAQREVNYYKPFNENDLDISFDDIYQIEFDLIRYHKGDIATMYNVYFYNDAAIMRPESKYEIDQLLDMMEENKDYEIRIHGHTNGNRPGKIIKRTNDQDFFALNENNKESFGTAKILSRERAQEIKDYLVSKGIPEERMDIRAWGGKKMIHEKLSNKARYNVRVEIEILEE